MWFQWLFSISLVVVVAQQDIWLVGIQPFTGADWDAGISMRYGAEIMLEEINNNPNILNGYTLKVVWQDGLCAKTHGTNLFLENLFDKTYAAFAPGVNTSDLDANKDGVITTADVASMQQQWTSAEVSPDPVGLLGSGCAGTAINIANILYKARYPMISNSATRPSLSDRTSFPNFYRTILPDTFFNDAWVAMAKILNQSSIVCVIGETENWESMGTRMATVAAAQQITLVGHDLSAEIAGFSGLQISIDSQSAAADIAKELVQLKQRIVVLQMFHVRNRLVLCEAYKLGYLNAIYMTMGWLPFGWWEIQDTSCTKEEITSMANYFISANMMFWRTDLQTQLSCAQSMTAAQFQVEWYRRQGKSVGDLSMTAEGFALALEATTTADAVCMYAKMLHNILVETASVSLADLSARTVAAYAKVQQVLAATDFEGIQGRVTYGANEADPKGSIIVQQLHANQTPAVIVDIGSYTDGIWNFFGKERLLFQFPGENFSTTPAGATSISAPVISFQDCDAVGKTLRFVDNTCADCLDGQVFVSGLCVCDKGYFQSSSSGCTQCAAGKFTSEPGKVTCSNCPVGKYAQSVGQTECSWCPTGYYAAAEGSATCTLTVRDVWLTAIQPFTGADWDAGISMRFGGQIMLEQVNNHSTLLPGFNLKVVWQDGLCAKAHGTNMFLSNIFDKTYEVFAPGVTVEGLDVDNSGVITTSDTSPLSQTWNSSVVFPDPVGLLGSGCSGTALNINQIAYMARYPLVSNSATRPGLSDRSSYPNFYRTILPDTKFPAAWIAMSKMLGQSSLVPVIADTENWGSMAAVFVQEANAAGVTMIGNPIAEMPGFTGLQISADTVSSAKVVAEELVRLKKRVVVLMLFAARNRYLLCEGYKLGLRNVVWMPMGWLAFGWWTVAQNGVDCTAEQMTSMATGFVSANMMQWRADLDTKLDCTESMTALQFKTEWFNRQGAPLDDYSMRPEGYALAGEGAMTADAVCMWARALHEVLIVQAMPLEYLSSRTPEAYTAIQSAFAATDFQGLQGRVYYKPNTAEPEGRIILQQLQIVNSNGGRRLSIGTPTIVDIASSQSGSLSFFGNAMEFQFANEKFTVAQGAITISGSLTSFAICSGDESLDMSDNVCKSCPPGKVFLSILGRCACNSGFFDNRGACEHCLPGKFAGVAGKSLCDDCVAGTFASTNATTECAVCGLGKYQANNRATMCESCWSGETTIQSGLKDGKMCNCAQGSYRPLNTSSDCRFLSTGTTRCACIACPEGMTCNFASEAKNFKAYGGNDELIPLLQEEYYSLATEPLSIYKCSLLNGCPGGVPQSCKHTRTDLVCAVCPDSWSPNSDTGECDKCSSAGILVILLGPLVVAVIIIITYYAANSPLSLNATITLTMSVTVGLGVTVLQVFGVFNQLSIPWPQTSSGMFKFFTVFLFSTGSFSMECGFGSDATMLYLYRILTPFCFIAFCWLLHLCSGLVAALSGGKCMRWKTNRVWNTIGQISQMLFIAFAVIAVRPFECAPHPNGTSSLILFPQILCWESDHTTMVTMAAFLLVLYLAPFAALCSWAIIKSPAISRHDPEKANVMLVRFRFLMYRFRPDKWWWGLVFLFRQTLLAFASSLPADDPHSQIMYTSVTLSVYLAVMCCAWPWKNHTLNCLDAGTTLGMLLVIVTATAFLPAGSQDKDSHVFLLTFFIVGLLAYIGSVMVLIGYNILRNGITGEFGRVETGQLETNKLARMWIDWQSMILKIDATNIIDMVRMMNQYDRQVLVKAVAVWENACGPLVPPDFIAGLPGTQTSSPRLRNLPNSTAPVSAETLKMKLTADLTRKLSESNSSASNFATSEKQVKENPVIESPMNEEADGIEFHMSPRGTPRILASRVWTALGPMDTPRSASGNLTPWSLQPQSPIAPDTPRGNETPRSEGGGHTPRSPRY